MADMDSHSSSATSTQSQPQWFDTVLQRIADEVAHDEYHTFGLHLGVPREMSEVLYRYRLIIINFVESQKGVDRVFPLRFSTDYTEHLYLSIMILVKRYLHTRTVRYIISLKHFDNYNTVTGYYSVK